MSRKINIIECSIGWQKIGDVVSWGVTTPQGVTKEFAFNGELSIYGADASVARIDCDDIKHLTPGGKGIPLDRR